MIRMENLSMDYGRGAVFSGLDLRLAGGTLVGLIGPNGAGKSTLLALSMGLISPTGGRIRVRGRALGDYGARALARRMTLVPQEMPVGFGFRVEEVVAMGRNPYLGRFRSQGPRDRHLIREAMAKTGVVALARRPMDTLSGGECRRVLIARAIAQETPIVLLDEVTANLDLCHQLEVMVLARDLARTGRLVVAAMHDLTLASRFCDRLVLLAQGAIQGDGTSRAVLTRDRLRRFFGVDAHVRAAPMGGGITITPLLGDDGGPLAGDVRGRRSSCVADQ